MADELRGIFPVVYTPFDERGAIDEADLRALVDHLLASGAHGLAAVGVGSESYMLTVAERKWVAEVVIDQVAGRAAVMIGTSAETTEIAVALSQHAERAGARLVFLTPPSTGPRTASVTRGHYRDVTEAIEIPLMLQDYQIPVLPEEVISLTREFPRIRYVKEEAQNVTGHRISAILESAPTGTRVFSAGRLLLDELERGAVGAITSSIGIADQVRAHDLFTSGDLRGAARAFNHSLPLIYARQQSFLYWTKEVLCRQGIFKHTYVRDPSAQPLDAQDHRTLTAIMELMGPPY